MWWYVWFIFLQVLLGLELMSVIHRLRPQMTVILPPLHNPFQKHLRQRYFNAWISLFNVSLVVLLKFWSYIVIEMSVCMKRWSLWSKSGGCPASCCGFSRPNAVVLINFHDFKEVILRILIVKTNLIQRPDGCYHLLLPMHECHFLNFKNSAVPIQTHVRNLELLIRNWLP